MDGNTTTSSAVASVLLQKDPELVTGAGAGLDSAGLKRKTEVIRRGIGLHHLIPWMHVRYCKKVGDLIWRRWQVLLANTPRSVD